MNIGLCIPTFNGAEYLQKSLPKLKVCEPIFHEILLIDSSESDEVKKLITSFGYNVLKIKPCDFDHGGTRQLAVNILADCDIIIFLTQDAILVDASSVAKLVSAFDDSTVAIAYGRQLPRPEAGAIEAHARLFGYPSSSLIKSRASIPEIGLRAAVVSNSFAAYRRNTLIELGGFPPQTLFGEDTLVGAKTILADHKIAYVADAMVYHSHGYSLSETFRRYFDNGAFYSREKWILDAFGKAEGSGAAYFASEIKYLAKTSFWLIPESIISLFVKYIGYRFGAAEKYFPARLKMHLSMNKAFWKREMQRPAASNWSAPC